MGGLIKIILKLIGMSYAGFYFATYLDE